MRIIQSTVRRWRGMTLVGTLVAIGVGTIVLVVVAAFSFYSSRSFAAMSNYVDLDNTSRKAVDVMTREIRQTVALNNYQTNSLTFVDYDGTLLQYIYDPANRTLSRVKGGITNALLTECDSLQFHIYQRTPRTGTNSFYATTNFALCKLLDMNWRCSRAILGKTANTETVQTAQVVLRN